MPITPDTNDNLQKTAENILDVIESVSEQAKSELSQMPTMNPAALASMNTFTYGEAIKTLGTINDTKAEDLIRLLSEPSIARVTVLDEDDKLRTMFFCRASPVSASVGGATVASYKAPIGRIASLPVGKGIEIETPGGSRYFEVVDRAELHPERPKSHWDSRNTIVTLSDGGPLTIESLREFLAQIDAVEEADDALDRLLAEDDTRVVVQEGIRRSIRTKMELRDQPILDQFQDRIFRLPLDQRLLIVGPPGSGKTTTLIRRLGQKLDRNFLEESELALVDDVRSSNSVQHSASWIMFTPTDLLKEYLKEAFAREGIPASNQHIVTWDSFRRDLARNKFGVLRTSQSRGLIEKANLNSLQPETINRQINWFEDFYHWQSNDFWHRLERAANELVLHPSEAFSELGKILSDRILSSSSGVRSDALVRIVDMQEQITDHLKSEKSSTDSEIRKTLNKIVNSNPGFLDELALLLSRFDSEADDDVNADEDEEEIVVPKTTRHAAVEAYLGAIRTYARAMAQKRNLSRGSRTAQIVEWIGSDLPEDAMLTELGINLIGQTAARQFRNPVQRLLTTTHSRYRRFRRERQAEAQWYTDTSAIGDQVSPLEVDVILLSILHTANEILEHRGISQRIDDPAYQSLRAVDQLQLNQVMVDEATDFSAIQLACMYAIAKNNILSFFGCGDFNQRLTAWGARSSEELKWAIPGIEIQSINITYRHTRQLNDFAQHLGTSSGGSSTLAVLPDHVNSEGFAPAIAYGLSSEFDTAQWLAERIKEIEFQTDTLPTIAILVNSEEIVGPLASELSQELQELNIRAVPFHQGQAIGEENDVRVFDVRHIKGLEFEAVFFVGIDELEQIDPDLFGRFLYVGATRAATFLGLTCSGDKPPTPLSDYADRLVSAWA